MRLCRHLRIGTNIVTEFGGNSAGAGFFTTGSDS